MADKAVYGIGIEAPGFGQTNRISWPDVAGLTGRKFSESLAGSYRNPWSDKSGLSGQMFPDSAVGCYWICWSDVLGFTGQV